MSTGGWRGPTWSQWYGATQEADEAADVANHNFEAAQKWKAYAKRLEQELDEIWELYRDAKGSAAGQRRVKEAVIDELQKVDPGNKLLDQATRQQLFDGAKQDAVKNLRRE